MLLAISTIYRERHLARGWQLPGRRSHPLELTWHCQVATLKLPRIREALGLQPDFADARRTVRAETGLNLGEFDRETQAFGLASPSR
jgi:hypothetical protein